MKFNSFVGISNNVKLIYKISAIVTVFAYFLFHAITGENGLLSYIKTKKQVEKQTENLESIERELASFKRNVKLLSNESLDPDLLEERCRIILNYSDPNDTTIREKSILQ